MGRKDGLSLLFLLLWQLAVTEILGRGSVYVCYEHFLWLRKKVKLRLRGWKRLLKDFNLLISANRGNENQTCSEIWYLLGEIGDRDSVVDKTEVTGLIVARTSMNPFEAVKKLRDVLNERPWDFRFALKVTPVERVVKTELEDIRKSSAELSSKIKENEKFRVTVEKRHTDLSRAEIIEAAAAEIEREVDLKKPDKIVLVEVLGPLTGISIVEPRDVLAVVKEKRSL